MGNNPSSAVINPKGQVFGVDGLRVADASVFPQITNGNLNGVVIAVAERMSDFVLDKELPPVEFTAENEPWTPPTLDKDREREALVA